MATKISTGCYGSGNSDRLDLDATPKSQNRKSFSDRECLLNVCLVSIRFCLELSCSHTQLHTTSLPEYQALQIEAVVVRVCISMIHGQFSTSLLCAGHAILMGRNEVSANMLFKIEL
ncbi:hypothetical protein ABZP36_032905 [Zizania latifolia]